MKYYVAAYDINGLQVLGNLDGQGIFIAKDFRKCAWFKKLKNRKTLNNRIMEYWIFDADKQEGPIVKIANMTHSSWR